MPTPYNIAPDPEAADLLSPLLAQPARAVARAPWAAAAVHWTFGAASFGLTHHLALRTAAIDEALREALAQGPRQVVILGAGLDNRAERMAELEHSAVFEVDHPNMTRRKRERRSIEGAGGRRATLVPVDFEQDRLDRSLLAAGFIASEPSFWIWEGVTIYLTPEAISETLRATAVLSSPGSRLALTYTRLNELSGGARGRCGIESWMIPPARVLAGIVGEPMRGLLSRAELERRLRDAGFALRSDESVAEWAPRYWPGRRAGQREWERLAVAERI